MYYEFSGLAVVTRPGKNLDVKCESSDHVLATWAKAVRTWRQTLVIVQPETLLR
jgi:hypothetical protein